MGIWGTSWEIKTYQTLRWLAAKSSKSGPNVCKASTSSKPKTVKLTEKLSMCLVNCALAPVICNSPTLWLRDWSYRTHFFRRIKVKIIVPLQTVHWYRIVALSFGYSAHQGKRVQSIFLLQLMEREALPLYEEHGDKKKPHICMNLKIQPKNLWGLTFLPESGTHLVW